MKDKATSKRICALGLGYIGLPTASLLATKGFTVRGVDVKPEVVAALARGETLIVEPSLDALVRSAVGSGKLTAHEAPAEAEVFIVAVPTPFHEDRSPDVRFVESAVDALCPCLKAGDLVILESTIPVGTTEAMAARIARQRPDLQVAQRGTDSGPQAVKVAHCPERVLPGHILRELVENDRIVGGVDQASAEAAREFYASFVSGAVIACDARAAELAKLSENAYRDVNIAFANELSLICDRLGVDVWELISLANRHPRVNILQPGPGVGGHCIAVDPWFIVASAPEESRLIRAAREVNDSKPSAVAAKVAAAAAETSATAVACLGLTYKADVDDLRESPAVTVVRLLAENPALSGVRLLAVEPHAEELPRELARLANVALVDLDAALDAAAVVVLLVDHRDFKNPSEKTRATLATKRIIDARGSWRGLFHSR